CLIWVGVWGKGEDGWGKEEGLNENGLKIPPIGEIEKAIVLCVTNACLNNPRYKRGLFGV
ncbi:MAG: hypothetical protein NTX03_03135, partial [Bacteroidetes bacterium]|nr:hypothetical protein [Bacteroidota bacterium]